MAEREKLADGLENINTTGVCVYVCVSYRQEETAVLLQSAQEAQEGHAGDDDAADQEHVGEVEVGQGRGERGHPEVHHHIHPEAQHRHATHLTGRKHTLQSGSCYTLLHLSYLITSSQKHSAVDTKPTLTYYTMHCCGLIYLTVQYRS